MLGESDIFSEQLESVSHRFDEFVPEVGEAECLVSLVPHSKVYWKGFRVKWSRKALV